MHSTMKQEKWVVSAKKADFQAIANTFGIDPVIARIIRNRDVVGEEAIDRFLHGQITDLYDPALLTGAEEAAALLKERIEEGAKIRVIGDYDIDGIMSTYIISLVLRKCGADFDAVIPHRITDGYGLNDHLITDAHENGVNTIITCDNGISAMKQIEDAKTLGMHVIVTDHHDVPFEETENGKRYLLPPADVIVDPKCEGNTYPYQEICGGVVALKVMQLLLAQMGMHDDDLTEELLECAAFATVGDVMPLADENRILVKHSLRHMEHAKNVGIRALIDACELRGKTLTAYHIGFILGPCMNAAGRLDTAKRALSLLHAKTYEEAMPIAAELRALNTSRKELTLEYVQKAISLIEEKHYDKDKVLVVYLPDCHESIAGIIAGRIRERYVRPTFVLTDSDLGDEAKGSGRSIPSYSMFEEMSKCKDLFAKYGGHPMAAGLSLPKDNIAVFREKINALCTLSEEDFVEKVTIDVPMPLAYVNRKLVDQLTMLEPFGTANPKPVFAQKNLTFLSEKIIGKNAKVAKYSVRDENQNTFELTYFGDTDVLHAELESKKTFSVLYYPSLNAYRGTETIQYIMTGYC